MKVRFTINKSRDGSTLKSNKVDFFYGYGEYQLNSDPPTPESVPTEKSYTQTDTYIGLISEERPLLIGMNYTEAPEINGQTIGPAVGVSKGETTTFQNVTVYKREIWEGGGESISHPVAIQSTASAFADYNVANNRLYEYTVYPEFAEEEGATMQESVSTHWQDWSLTELHPVSGKKDQYTASNSDVWIFKYNVEPSEQTQNISKTQQDNLTAYPKFSHGLKNNISSSVTALLGSEMAPYDFLTTRREYVKETDSLGNETWSWQTVRVPGYADGGYTERLPFSPRLTSNQKIDMLNAWRSVAYSGNPKLIKDRKGQKFLVQITGSSNTTQDTWSKQPDTITFSWVEIGSLDGVTITSKIN